MSRGANPSDNAREKSPSGINERIPLIQPQPQPQQQTQSQQKRIVVTVGTTGDSELVAGLMEFLRKQGVVRSANFREIPYNVRDMDQLEFDDVDVFILCHSIKNRRLSITDVTDSLYDRLLQRACHNLGKSKVIILVYDFKSNDLQADALAIKLQSFKIQQTTACRKSSAVVFAGQCASSPPELPQDQLEKLQSSLQAAASPPIMETIIVLLRKCLICAI
ncbi:uncharacterized protein [Diadema antillarum]|uniref:uncharacterized protein isoform X2 n=1 Tax=Diadema antillarum TaxID=105358 RepID=UPI003A842D81